MKIKLKWIALVILVVLIAGGVMRALSSRAAQKEALAVQQEAQKQQAPLELSGKEIVQAKTLEINQTLPLSGTVKAVNSAFVKARVAGELQDLRVREGDVVVAGQVVARVDPTESAARVRQAQQQAEAAKAQVDIARRSFDNNKSLVDQGFISRTALDTSSSNLAAAEANYRAAAAAIDLAVKSEQDTVLKAPIAGLVAQRLAQPGERIAIDGRVLEIVDLSRLELEATLSAAYALQIKLGQVAKLSIEGAPQTLNAKVVRINPTTVAGSRAVLAYLALDNVQGLRQGMFAQGKLDLGKRQALVVPLHVVRTDKPLPYVQTVAGGKVAHQTVTKGLLGEINDQTMVEVSGVTENTEVLVGSVGPLREGTTLTRTKGDTGPAPTPAPATSAPGEKGKQ